MPDVPSKQQQGRGSSNGRADAKAAAGAAKTSKSRTARGRSSSEPKASVPAKAKSWEAVASTSTALPDELGAPLSDISTQMKMPVWMLIHTGRRAQMDYSVLREFLAARDHLKADQTVALVIDSPGGYADMAFRIARIFCRHSAGFVAVIPRYAKSAATLVTLGADRVIMAHDAEIGPLDVQVYDEEREQPGSALDEIQALDQLHQVSLMQLNQNLELMRSITRRRYDIVLPYAIQMASDMMTPLLDKIDTVHYAKQSRLLAVAEEYAMRLMEPHVGRVQARKVAERLVKRYPEHGFVIDRREAKTMIDVEDHTPAIDSSLRRIETYLWETEVSAFGLLKEKT